MRYVRSWVGVGALLVFSGTAAAQPAAFPGPGSGGSGFGASAPLAPPAMSPPLVPAAPPVRSLSALPEEHLPVKDLTPHGGFGDIHPPEDKHHGHGEVPEHLTAIVPEHGGFYTSAEYLLMRPRNSDFDFVIRSAPGAGLATNGPIDSLKYQLGSGVRVEAGYLFDGAKWEVAFGYTYFTSGADATVFGSAAAPLFPTLTRPGLTDRALSATGTADLDYQVFDILAGRRFVIEDNLAVRAIAGFRFSDIRQTFSASYDGLDARRAAVNNRSRFQGFGPMVGLEGTLAGPMGFHLYGKVTGGFLSGRSNNTVLETNDNRATTYVNTRYNIEREVPFGSAALGMGWQYRSIALRAGYEVTHWQGIFERPRFVDDVGQGKVITRPANLSLEGLFIQATLLY